MLLHRAIIGRLTDESLSTLLAKLSVGDAPSRPLADDREDAGARLGVQDVSWW